MSQPAHVTLHEFEEHLSELVNRVAAGEEIVIDRAGERAVRLVPDPEPKVLRRPGAWRGRVFIREDFDDPLPPEIQDAFDGKNP